MHIRWPGDPDSLYLNEDGSSIRRTEAEHRQLAPFITYWLFCWPKMADWKIFFLIRITKILLLQDLFIFHLFPDPFNDKIAILMGHAYRFVLIFINYFINYWKTRKTINSEIKTFNSRNYNLYNVTFHKDISGKLLATGQIGKLY